MSELLTILLAVSNVLLLTALGGMGWLLVWDRRQAVERERELLGAVLAEHVDDYVRVIDGLRTKPDDKIRTMQVENELALNAQKLSQMEGIPIS
jgi:hypothetical protein